jgi:hypothetical protein
MMPRYVADLLGLTSVSDSHSLRHIESQPGAGEVYKLVFHWRES